MLISFRTGNFRSFKDDQELSFVASAKKDHGSQGFKCPGFRNGILPLAAIYGAIASGKSNLILALKFMRRAILQSYSDWKEGSPFPFSPFLGNNSDLMGVSVTDDSSVWVCHFLFFHIFNELIFSENVITYGLTNYINEPQYPNPK